MRLRVPVVEAKLHPPSLPPVMLYRQRYQELFDLLRSSRLSRVIAPAGYGKSTFLAAFAGQPGPVAGAGSGEEVKPRVAWYTLDEIDNDAAVFFTHLVRSLGLALDSFGGGTAQTLASVADVERDSRIVAAAMAEELWQGMSGKQEELVIVLDDYHVVAGTPVVNETVHFLLNNLPLNVHLCLAGRHQPPLRVERLALQAQVHDVGPQELAFEVEEVKQLLSRVNGGSIAPGLADEIAASTECWPAGVVLAVQSARKGKGIKFGRPDGIPGHGATFNYFAEEIFALQRPEMRRFLVGAASLKYLTVQACEAVLGCQAAEALLSEALQRGLFLSLVETGGEKIFRFHQLFKSFLLRAREEFLPGEAVTALHVKAAGYYEETGMLDAALSHFLDAQLITRAADLLYRKGLELIEQGHVDQLRRWLNMLPSGVIEGNPRFLYYMGFVYQNSDPARAVDCLDRAAKGLAGTGELGLEVRSLIYLAPFTACRTGWTR